jgi:hypothetical protein
VFADEAAARKAIGRMSAIHGGVERQRGYQIPDWAYRDVLYMLIDYSERAYALLQRPLTAAEQESCSGCSGAWVKACTFPACRPTTPPGKPTAGCTSRTTCNE